MAPDDQMLYADVPAEWLPELQAAAALEGIPIEALLRCLVGARLGKVNLEEALDEARSHQAQIEALDTTWRESERG